MVATVRAGVFKHAYIYIVLQVLAHGCVAFAIRSLIHRIFAFKYICTCRLIRVADGCLGTTNYSSAIVLLPFNHGFQFPCSHRFFKDCVIAFCLIGVRH